MHRRLSDLTLALLLLAPTLLIGARPAFAHVTPQSYDLPLPLWLFLYGAGAAVLVSFLPISLFAGKERSSRGYPRFDLLRLGPLRTLLTARPFLTGLRLLSVAIFLLVILSGVLGGQTPGINFAPIFVWVVWWVGFSFFVAFVGNVWPLVNPWKILFEWADGSVRRLGVRGGLDPGGSAYPAALGVWPSVALFAAFIWVENVFEEPFLPLSVAFFVFVYSIITWLGMVVFGKDAWLRGGEVFSVFFDLLGKFAPTEVRVADPKLCQDCSSRCRTEEGECVNCYECFGRAAPKDRELNLRPPAAGLGYEEPVAPGSVFFVVLVLAAVSFDGLLETPPSVALMQATPLITPTSELLLLPLLMLAVYLGFVKLSQLLGGGAGRLGRYATAYVYSLVPIAIAYQVAHYFTYLLFQGSSIVRLVSDPLGRGWNLFGTAQYRSLNPGVISAETVWYTQVALIVAGHVIAVYLAHLIALRLLGDRRKALLSQLPMLALMVLYTIFSLWIISQPIAVSEAFWGPQAERQNSSNPATSP